MSAIAAASMGLAHAVRRFERASAALAEGARAGESERMAAGVVDQIEASTQFKASLVTVAIADEMTRQLIDIKV